MFHHLVRGDGDSAAKHRKFYDEYLAVMDLTAEFYLQTIDSVFVQHLLPRGLMTSRGRMVDLSAIRRPALMTVEGAMDDITGTGQCSAALQLCLGIPANRKSHFECPTVGHYGIFNGSRFRREIAPRVSTFVRTHASTGPLYTLRRAATPSTSAIIANIPNRPRIPGDRLFADSRTLLSKPTQRRPRANRGSPRSARSRARLSAAIGIDSSAVFGHRSMQSECALNWSP
jgi:hypothetical protein